MLRASPFILAALVASSSVAHAEAAPKPAPPAAPAPAAPAPAAPAPPPAKVVAPSSAKPQPIIPPGHDEFFSKVLGGGAASMPGGCVFDKASIDKSVVFASYLCGGKPAKLELRYPDALPPTAVKTASFGIVPDSAAAPPAALIKEIHDRLVANEASWKWSQVNPAVSDFQFFIPTLPTQEEMAAADGDALSGSQRSDLESAISALSTPGQAMAAVETLTSLAEKNPHHGVLQALWAAVHAASPDKAATEKLVQAADANPNSKARQFVAGAALSLLAYKSGAKPELRQSNNEAAIRYLAKARPDYDFSPTLFMLMALSEFRVGHQGEAEELINRAITQGPKFPDAFYARGEVLQAVNTTEAKADLDKAKELLKARPDAASLKRVIYAAGDMRDFLDGKPAEKHPDLDVVVNPKVQAPPSRVARGMLLLALLLAGTIGVVFRLRRSQKATPPA